MLTKDDAQFYWEGDRVEPDRLKTQTHAHYPFLAAQLLEIYQNGAGKMRSELWEAVRAVFHAEADCPSRRIQAFCALLDEKSDFGGRGGADVARKRMRIFELAAARHPLVRVSSSLLSHDEEAVKANIAEQVGGVWEEIERELFSDVFELRRLEKFTGYPSPESLLTRYNEAQLQACLYGATEVKIRAARDYRAIVMAAKRAMLMHETRKMPDGRMEFIFYGPASSLRVTRRYGVDIAKIIPTLLACSEWEMEAPIKIRKWGRMPTLKVSSKDRYQSSKELQDVFDSKLEEDFSDAWGKAKPSEWRLERESDVLFHHQKAFFPDFTLVHTTGRRVFLEIVGFWTPEYLDAKCETLKDFAGEDILLAVRGNYSERFKELGFPVVAFRKRLTPDSLLPVLTKRNTTAIPT